MSLVRKPRKPAQRLRTAVDVLPRRTRKAMLRGIDDNTIIAGAYVDRSGGVCPMLAAHRNGGRTSFASFAVAWDRFTDARQARRATKREVRALRSYLEMSLLREEQEEVPLTQLAARIRDERRRFAVREAAEAPARPRYERVQPRHDTGERDRAPELRKRPFWSWLRPTRRYDEWSRRLAAAEEQLSEQKAEQALRRVKV